MMTIDRTISSRCYYNRTRSQISITCSFFRVSFDKVDKHILVLVCDEPIEQQTNKQTNKYMYIYIIWILKNAMHIIAYAHMRPNRRCPFVYFLISIWISSVCWSLLISVFRTVNMNSYFKFMAFGFYLLFLLLLSNEQKIFQIFSFSIFKRIVEIRNRKQKQNSYISATCHFMF